MWEYNEAGREWEYIVDGSIIATAWRGADHGYDTYYDSFTWGWEGPWGAGPAHGCDEAKKAALLQPPT